MALRADDVDLGRDHDLVVRSQAGDDQAFEDLYRRYFGRLYRYCLRRVNDPHAAEELAQEAFVRAYRALPRLGGERRFYPWLTVIASRLCTDEFRRRARSEPLAVVDLGAGEGGQERVIQAVDTELLVAAMGRLTPRHRDVLTLREHRGWSYQHIADYMGVTLGTVEALLHRARKALKREFDHLAGPDAVPVATGGATLGWLGRKVAALRLRLRVDEWSAPTWAPAVGNAVAAAVVVVGSTTMITGGGSQPAVAVSMAPVAAVAPAPAPAPAAAPVAEEEAAVATAPTPAASTKAPAAKPGDGSDGTSGVDVPDVGLGTRDVGNHGARERAQGSELHGEVEHDDDGVVVGVNPTAVVDDVLQTAENYEDDLRKDAE